MIIFHRFLLQKGTREPSIQWGLQFCILGFAIQLNGGCSKVMAFVLQCCNLKSLGCRLGSILFDRGAER